MSISWWCPTCADFHVCGRNPNISSKPIWIGLCRLQNRNQREKLGHATSHQCSFMMYGGDNAMVSLRIQHVARSFFKIFFILQRISQQQHGTPPSNVKDAFQTNQIESYWSVNLKNRHIIGSYRPLLAIMFCVATKFGWVLVTKLIFLSKMTVSVFDIGFLIPGVVAAIFRRYRWRSPTVRARTSLLCLLFTNDL